MTKVSVKVYGVSEWVSAGELKAGSRLRGTARHRQLAAPRRWPWRPYLKYLTAAPTSLSLSLALSLVTRTHASSCMCRRLSGRWEITSCSACARCGEQALSSEQCAAAAAGLIDRCVTWRRRRRRRPWRLAQPSSIILVGLPSISPVCSARRAQILCTNGQAVLWTVRHRDIPCTGLARAGWVIV